MCLIGIALNANQHFSFVLAANRDESLDRPALPLRWWQAPSAPAPRLLSGQDLKAGGTWLGLNEQGGFAALTNVRLPAAATPKTSSNLPDPPSRGHLPLEALTRAGNAKDALTRHDPSHFRPFNLLTGRLEQAALPTLCFESSLTAPKPLNTGVHVLSNASLNSPWPKSEAIREALIVVAEQSSATHIENTLLRTLANQTVPNDSALPDTGIGLERERLLAPAFIRAPGYGTRVSSIITQERNTGLVSFLKVTWNPLNVVPEQAQWRRFTFIPARRPDNP